ncbi:MAG: YfhO family protein [Candidatus Omnitrophica bacterium]|nr:YfhO family protein [Candidatus Omnitrophota bacterium]
MRHKSRLVNLKKNIRDTDAHGRKIYFIFLFLLLLFSYRDLFMVPHLSISDDMIYDIIPHVKFFADNFAKGIIPLWNPYCESGVPALTQPFVGPFYPLFFIYYLIPAQWFSNLQVFIHLCLAAAFLFLFAEKIGLKPLYAFTTSCVFVFSSIPLKIIAGGYVTFGVAVFLLPMVLYFFERLLQEGTNNFLFVWLSGIAVGLLFLGSHTVGVYLCLLSAVVYVFLRIVFLENNALKVKLFFLIILAFFISICFSAIHLFPYIRNVLASGWGQRNIIVSLKAIDIPLYIFPSSYEIIRNHILANNYFGTTSAVLIIVFLHIVRFPLNKYFKVFSIFGVFFLLLALGKYGFIAEPMRLLLPFFGVISHLEITEIPFILAASIILGMSLQTIGSLLEEKRADTVIRASRNTTYLTVLLVCVVFWVYAYALRGKPEYILLFKTDIVRALLFSLVPLAILVFLSKIISKRAIMFLLIFFCVGDLLYYQFSAFRSATIIVNSKRNNGKFNYYEPGEISSFLNSQPEQYYRIFRDRWPRYQENRTTALKIFEVKGMYDTPVNEYFEYVSYMNFPDRGGRETFCRQIFKHAESPLADLLNIKYAFYDKANEPPSEKFVFLKELDSGVRVYENTRYIPRVFFVKEIEVSASSKDTLQRLSKNNFKVRDVAIVENTGVFKGKSREAFSGDPDSGEQNKAEIVEYSPNKIRVSATVYHRAFLVLSEIYFPGWKAYVDGKKETIYRTDYILRGLLLEKGKHSIVLAYQPWEFYLGISLTFTTLFLFLGYLIKRIVQRA